MAPSKLGKMRNERPTFSRMNQSRPPKVGGRLTRHTWRCGGFNYFPPLPALPKNQFMRISFRIYKSICKPCNQCKSDTLNVKFFAVLSERKSAAIIVMIANQSIFPTRPLFVVVYKLCSKRVRFDCSTIEWISVRCVRFSAVPLMWRIETAAGDF